MPFCGTRSLSRQVGSLHEIRPLPCGCWSCPDCERRNKKRIRRMMEDGKPDRLVTITARAITGEDPEIALDRLYRVWAQFAREERKRHPSLRLEYLLVPELTKRGWPHLHILVRSNFIAQKRLSDYMLENLGAPVVDVRAVRSLKGVAKYVGKYLTKRPLKMCGRRRFARSRDWIAQADRDARERARRP